ncbi:hypothetical protein [uncultured Clostridium sp.]|uniref:hypothetical protein n=1 Tax=uncultured Clostridium sp. TaxID=59620 RepID=UPI0028ECA7EE|nr:hypothetical protein [uncultured Clostridium sp.]
MDNRYQTGELLNDKYPILDSKEGRIVAESSTVGDAELIKTALNCYEFMIPLMTLSK